MRGLIYLLGFIALLALIGFSALVAHVADWEQIKAPLFNAVLDAWDMVWEGGLPAVPWIPVVGWAIGIIAFITFLTGASSLLGGFATRAWKEGRTPPETPMVKPLDVTQERPRWWWSSARKYAWDKATVSKITGIVPIRTMAAARQALHDYMQAMDALKRDLERDYEPLVAHRGRLPSHRAVFQLVHDLLAAAKRDGKIIIETAPAAKVMKPTKLSLFSRIGAAFKLLWNGEAAKPAATPRKRVAKPKAAAHAAAPAPATPVAAPVVVAEPPPPAAGPAPAAAEHPAAAATAGVSVTMNFVGPAPADIVVEDVPPAGPKPIVPDPDAPDAEVVEPTPAAKPPTQPPADRSDKGSGGRRDGRDRRFNPDDLDREDDGRPRKRGHGAR